MRLIVFLLVILALTNICLAKDLIVGTSYNSQLIWQNKAEYMAIPFKTRVKQAFYSDPNQKPIKGIVVRDLNQSGATATITAGGINFPFVNLRLKSESGGSINYQIEIYAD